MISKPNPVNHLDFGNGWHCFNKRSLKGIFVKYMSLEYKSIHHRNAPMNPTQNNDLFELNKNTCMVSRIINNDAITISAR